MENRDPRFAELDRLIAEGKGDEPQEQHPRKKGWHHRPKSERVEEKCAEIKARQSSEPTHDASELFKEVKECAKATGKPPTYDPYYYPEIRKIVDFFCEKNHISLEHLTAQRPGSKGDEFITLRVELVLMLRAQGIPLTLISRVIKRNRTTVDAMMRRYEWIRRMNDNRAGILVRNLAVRNPIKKPVDLDPNQPDVSGEWAI